jgi:hypothetical protein
MGCFWIFFGNISLFESYEIDGSTPDKTTT